MEKLEPGDPQGIGAYRLLARLGAGGMGYVYLARSDRGRTVAVKLVRAELARQEEFRARFRQEVRAARQVGGFWTAPVLDADTEAVVPWVATGYVAGPSLERIVGRDHGALPERSVRILAAGLAHALKDIHAAGIVHRDLKPSNVLVTIDGPRVIDFGIARALETVTDAGLTRTGVVVGSPGFMAPEQVRGDRITPACDIFCLGSVLAYAATGRLPFGTANSGVHALMFRIAQEEPDLDGVPEGIAELVRDCLQKDPGDRPTLDGILERTGAEDTVTDGRSRDPWLPAPLVAQLGRHAVRLLDTEDPTTTAPAPPGTAGAGAAAPSAPGAPVVPSGPVGPVGPAGPVAPVGPAGPVAPAGPAGSAGPVAPVGPAGPVPAARSESAAAPRPEQTADGREAAAREGDPRQTSGADAAGAPAGPARPPGPPAPGSPAAGPGRLNDLPTMAAGQAARAGRTPPSAPAAQPSTPPPTPGATPPGLTAAAPPGPGPAPGATVQPAPPAPGAPPPGPAYGFPHQSAPGPGPAPAYGFPHQPAHAPGSAPGWPGGHGPGAAPSPYGTPAPGIPPHPHAAAGPAYGGHPQAPADGGNSRSTVLLVVIALIVALAAGGTMYALMNRGDGGTGGSSAPSPAVTGEHESADPGTSEPDPEPTTEDSPSASTDGAVPAAYLGTWTTTIDNASGRHTRELTIKQGEVGDTVLSLVAEGPSDGGSDYRCVFVAELSEDPGDEGPLAIGPSLVRTGPGTACSPGSETEVTLLPDGTLERVNVSTGERLVYRKE